jgi:hypothetical protein
MRTLLIVIIIGLASVKLHAQYKPLPSINIDSLEQEIKNSRQLYLKTNPLRVLIGPLLLSSEYRLLAEFQINRNQSFEIGASFINRGALFEQFFDSTGTSLDDFVINGFRIQGGYRVYLFNNFFYKNQIRDTPNGITGIYITPHASYMNMRISTKQALKSGYYYNIFLVDGNVKLGVQLSFGKFILDSNIGVGYKQNDLYFVDPHNVTKEKTPDGLEFVFDSNLKLHLGLNMGWKF